MLRATILLICFGAVLAYTTVNRGGVLSDAWDLALLGLSLILFVGYLPLKRSSSTAPPDWPLYLCAFALPSLALIQLLPLPQGILAAISPGRAALLQGLSHLGAAPTLAPLSLRPSATLNQFLRLLGYAATFLIARDLMWRFPRGQWRVIAPVLVVAVSEAALGLAQQVLNPGNVYPSGTFVNRDHFSALLELALPFALAGFFEYWLRIHPRPLLALLLAGGAVVLLGGIGVSLSRAGFVLALAIAGSVLVVLVNRSFRGFARFGVLVAAALAAVVLVVVLAPPELVSRFADSSGGGPTLDNRLGFWRESLQVAGRYLWTGCGFGAFTSAVGPFRHAAPGRTLNYAHNEPLQLLAEGGVLALGVGLIGFFLLFRRIREAWPAGSRRLLPLACTLSLSGALLHSLVDFSLEIPACAMALSWVAGMAAGLPFSPAPKTPGEARR